VTLALFINVLLIIIITADDNLGLVFTFRGNMVKLLIFRVRVSVGVRVRVELEFILVFVCTSWT